MSIIQNDDLARKWQQVHRKKFNEEISLAMARTALRSLTGLVREVNSDKKEGDKNE